MRVGIVFCVYLVMTSAIVCADSNVTQTLENVRQGVVTALNKMDRDLQDASQKIAKKGLTGEEARTVLKDVCKNNSCAVDCAVVDAAGKMLTIEPDVYKKYEGKDISAQEHVMALRKDKKPVMSKVFRSEEGIDAADFSYPIFSESNELLGSVSLLVMPATLLFDVVNKAAKDVVYEIWVMQTDGLILFDKDEKQIGKNLFNDGIYKPYASLISLGERIVKEESGSGSYEFLDKLGAEVKSPVKKNAQWATVGIHGAQWKVVVAEIEKAK